MMTMEKNEGNTENHRKIPHVTRPLVYYPRNLGSSGKYKNYFSIIVYGTS